MWTWVAKGLGFIWEEPLMRKDITWAVPLDSARVPCWIEEVRSGYDTGWWVMTATYIQKGIKNKSGVGGLLHAASPKPKYTTMIFRIHLGDLSRGAFIILVSHWSFLYIPFQNNMTWPMILVENIGRCWRK